MGFLWPHAISSHLPCQIPELAQTTPESSSRRPVPSRLAKRRLLPEHGKPLDALASRCPLLSHGRAGGRIFLFFSFRWWGLRLAVTRRGKPPHSPVHPDLRFAIHPHLGPAPLTMSVMSGQVLGSATGHVPLGGGVGAEFRWAAARSSSHHPAPGGAPQLPGAPGPSPRV